jgi:hypothetical protein
MMTAWEYEVRINFWNAYYDLLSELWQPVARNSHCPAPGAMPAYRSESGHLDTAPQTAGLTFFAWTGCLAAEERNRLVRI